MRVVETGAVIHAVHPVHHAGGATLVARAALRTARDTRVGVRAADRGVLELVLGPVAVRRQ